MQAFGLCRIGRDVELRNLANGDAVANVSLAFAFGKKATDGKRPVQWLEGALFGKRAEALAQYLLKGQLVSVTLDDVHIEEFKRGDGTAGTKLVGKISALDLAGGSERAAAPPPPPAPPKKAAVDFDDTDSDIPF